MTTTTRTPVCDFCGLQAAPAALTWHPARTFTQLTVNRPGQVLVVPCTCCCAVPDLQPDDDVREYVSLSAWLGCAACSALIAAGDADGLLRRSVAAHRDALATEMDLLRVWTGVAASHARFWAHREGLN